MKTPSFEEITKKVYSYLQTNYIVAPLVFPSQDVYGGVDNWVEVYIISFLFLPTRTNTLLGSFTLHCGIFSKAESIYKVDELTISLSDLLHKITIESDNYTIRFKEVEITRIYDSNKEESLIKPLTRYNVLRVSAQIFG